MSGVGLSPALATCETSQVLLAGVSGGFPGVLPFCPTYRLARLYDRVATVLEKSLENEIFSRLGNSQGISILVREI